MKRVARIMTALVLLSSASAVTAQSFNQELSRYRASKFECEAAFRRQLERPRNGCSETCRTVAESVRDRCLATAERRYGEALRRALRIRR